MAKRKASSKIRKPVAVSLRLPVKVRQFFVRVALLAGYPLEAVICVVLASHVVAMGVRNPEGADDYPHRAP